MGKTYDHIPESMIEWAQKQKAFWVATAPLAGEGRVNVSPKGVDGTFHFVNKNRVWYEDLTGSGSETISHLREKGNGRITILFQAFEGGPRILRMFGKGYAYEFGTKEYEELLPAGKRQPGSRAVIVMDVDRVGTSCGWGVPFYTYTGPRETLINFGVKMEKTERLQEYWAQANVQSVDGLPSLQTAHVTKVVPDSAIKEVKGGLPAHSRLAATKVANKATAAPMLLSFLAGLIVAVLSMRFSAVARSAMMV